MKKQAEVKLVKAAVIEAIVAETSRQTSAVALDLLDEHISGLPLDIVTAARRAFASGKAPLQVIVSGAKRLAERRRDEIRQADRERAKALAKAKAEEKAKAEAEAAAEAAAAAKERIQQIAEEETDESVKALLLASLETPPKKSSKKSTSTTTDKGESLISRIRALLPCNRSTIHTALADVKDGYINHYLREYSEGKPSKGKSGIKVNKIGSKADAADYFYI